MANISAIKLPDGNTYTIKDSVSGYTTNTGTVTSVAAGTGLITNQTNNAAITSSGTIKANLNSETSLGTIGTTTKLYAVGVDDNGQLCVDVPWENSDTKVTSSVKTTGGTIYLVGSSNSATITSTLSKHASLSATFSTDTSTDGYTRLTLGNSKTSSTEGGKKGILRLYGTGSGRIDLTVAAANNYTITLPNKTGTIALTTDIPSSSSTPTADTIAEFDSNAHMNSTDMTEQALETYVDSLDIQGSVFVDATDVPTAGEIAKFDSTANMSSTDMTTGSGSEVEAFVNGLNVSNSISVFPVRVFDSIAPYNCTTANTMQYTGVNVTIPANSFFAISARATYNGAKPLNVAINDSSTNANANVATGAYSDVMCTCSYISFTSTQKTFYLWVKYATVNTSAGSLYIDGWYIKQ